MAVPAATPNATDKVFLKAVIFLLFGALTVSRVKMPLEVITIPPWYEVILYFDAPLVAAIGALFVFALLKLGSDVRIRNLFFFWPIPALLIWIFISGVSTAQKPLLFAVIFVQWVLAYLAFVIIPPLVRAFDLTDFALDTFLGWSIFGAAAHLAVTAIHPGQILNGVYSVFGGNRAHVGVYFLISLSTGVYAWSLRRRRLHAVAAALSLLGLLVSGSRAGQLGAVMFLILLILSSRSWKIIGLSLPPLAGMLIFFKLIIANRAADSFAVGKGVSVDASAGMRLIIWLKSWEIITQTREHFLYGIGFTNFRFLYYKLVAIPFYANAAHNMYLQYWVETGLIGLVLLLLTCGSLLLYCWIHRARHPSLLYMGFLTLAMMFTGMTQETFMPEPALGNVLTLYFLIMGLATYRAKSDPDAAAPAKALAAA
jgi:O-antigen ligase